MLIDRDSFSILYLMLEDDVNFLFFILGNNINININYDNYDWYNISQTTIPKYILDKLVNHLEWNVITKKYIDDELFLRDNKENIIWSVFSNKMTFGDILSYQFFEDFKDKIIWGKISSWRFMAEDFIIQFENELDWEILSKYQGLTEYLINRFNHKIVWEELTYNRSIEDDLKNRMLSLYVENNNDNVNNDNNITYSEENIMNIID